MAIEYQPPGLKWVVNSSFAEKRLKNREAQVVATTPEGNVVWDEVGPLVGLHERALTHLDINPEHEKRFVEFTCTSHVSPPVTQQRIMLSGD